jgi:hypothetical protein
MSKRKAIGPAADCDLVLKRVRGLRQARQDQDKKKISSLEDLNLPNVCKDVVDMGDEDVVNAVRTIFIEIAQSIMDDKGE